jgi:oxygen-dependent protoporphyrinogen oxidase
MMTPERPRVAIVGGGLAGLVAAFRLRARASVTVLEAGPRLGGQIHTALEDGFVVERGGEGFVARSTALPALAADLGMPPTELVDQATLRSYGYDGASLQALQPGEAARLLGFQVSRDDLGRGIRSMRRGMGSLLSALEGALRSEPAAELRTASPVRTIERGERGLRVIPQAGTAVAVDAVVVATSAAAAAEVLAGLGGETARALSAAVVQSSVTVELAFARDAVQHALDGSGFVVAQGAQQEGLRACTWSSSKFAARAEQGKTSLRAFFRPTGAELATLDDAAWIARAERGIARALPLSAPPLRAWVSRWPRALPVFDDAHRARVAALEALLVPMRAVLAGSAFHGSGIDAAVQSGERAALALQAMLAEASLAIG